LVIPSSLAYADRPPSEDIKPYSTLVFDVELVKIKPGKHDLAKKVSAPAVAGIDANTPTASTIKAATLKSAPGQSGKIIAQLPLNAELYIISVKDVGGYCKVIDAKTKKTGWVSKAAVKLADKEKK
jgi:hypothetical protein